MNAGEQATWQPGSLCLISLILYAMHIILWNPLLRRWRFGCTWQVTPTIEQDEWALGCCCICMERIMIINGRASYTFGGGVRFVCDHYYHHSCCIRWMRQRICSGLYQNCPICRQEMEIFWTDYGLTCNGSAGLGAAQWISVPFPT
jgi:hypothetical protein